MLSGKPFDDYVRRRVLQPLGMFSTDWMVPEADRSRMAATYRFEAGKPPRREPDVPYTFASGGAGLIGTIDDYLRFARMLLAEGELEGTRILRPTTVRLMATDQLDPMIAPRHFMKSDGVGVGLGGSVRIWPPEGDEPPGTVGEFSWGGAASTLYWIDPANRLAVVFFVQKLPFDDGLHRDLRVAVYGAGAGAASAP